jgi:hypothetical protein
VIEIGVGEPRLKISSHSSAGSGGLLNGAVSEVAMSDLEGQQMK